MFFQNALAGKNQFWRYVVSFFTIMLSWQGLGAVPLLIVILLNDPWSLVKMGGKLDFEAMGVDANLGFFVLFLMFVFGLAGLVISIRFIHQKPVCKVITGRSRISWSRFFSGALIWGGMLGIFLAVQLHLFPERYEMNFSASRFLPLLVMAVIMVPMQTGFEEILFRGYYMQAISLISKNRWAPLLITSAIFGLLHIFNPEIGRAH
ncbi:MAG: CPBP family intramembrane metalloprotease, partial [Bacteroidetes bacterium]|nr:CPBP family intramembrane metalloprotease [Bacteroidota bacterium]